MWLCAFAFQFHFFSSGICQSTGEALTWDRQSSTFPSQRGNTLKTWLSGFCCLILSSLNSKRGPVSGSVHLRQSRLHHSSSTAVATGPFSLTRKGQGAHVEKLSLEGQLGTARTLEGPVNIPAGHGQLGVSVGHFVSSRTPLPNLKATRAGKSVWTLAFTYSCFDSPFPPNQQRQSFSQTYGSDTHVSPQNWPQTTTYFETYRYASKPGMVSNC